MTTHAMIDIETLDTQPSSVILSVGAVKFDPFSDKDSWDHQHWKIDIEQQLEEGRTTSEATLEWWGKNEPHVIDEAFSDEGRIQAVDFAKELNKWIVGSEKIWCQGPQFDMVIIGDLFKQVGHHTNWQFWQIMDSRTLFNMLPYDPRKEVQKDAHDALADAYWQAKCVRKAMVDLKINNIR